MIIFRLEIMNKGGKKPPPKKDEEKEKEKWQKVLILIFIRQQGPFTMDIVYVDIVRDYCIP